jgi:hypothetical protein
MVCDHCPRHGQYRKETLIEKFGGDVLMPDVRHLNCAMSVTSSQLAPSSLAGLRGAKCRSQQSPSPASDCKPQEPNQAGLVWARK